MNPFENLPIYNEGLMAEYKQKALGTVSTLLKDSMEMQLGAKREWRPVRVELNSHRELKFETNDAPAYSSSIGMREAVEVTLNDSPSGGTAMSITTPVLSYEMRAKDGQVTSAKDRLA